LLSAETIAADGVTLLGWVANAVDPDYAYAAETIETLRTRLPAPLLGVTAWQDPFEPNKIAAALDAGTRRLWA
jgi:dethiobiotin synthetase